MTIMNNRADQYVEERLTWFDRVCQWAWVSIVLVLLAIVFSPPVPPIVMGLCFGGSVFVSNLLLFALQMKVRRLRSQYYQEKRIKP